MHGLTSDVWIHSSATHHFLKSEETFCSRKFNLVQVDVWSVGVIYYQMLYGKRPFGHNQCQEQLVREDTIINARKVEFPARPSVSQEAKVCTLLSCLGYLQHICSHSYCNLLDHYRLVCPLLSDKSGVVVIILFIYHPSLFSFHISI